MSMLLEVEAADVHYGELKALHGIDLRIAEGETLAVIGANGAGKSTLLKTIAGVLRPSSGAVRFAGEDVSGLGPNRRVAQGIALTPEGRRIFGSMTVEENLLVGAHTRRPGPWSLAAVYEAFPILAELQDRRGGVLSGGQQQATAIARALMSNPRLLLLDEVSLGLAPVVIADIYAALPRIAEMGTTVLIVEQDLSQVLRAADRVQCLLEGRTVLEAPAAEVTREQVAAAYFGLDREAS
ncbi:MAG TPA: ABC transporter ATP-binding protein [Nocardioides sp.]|nr:ABC transporter ATP-binding protein [Nocardioides sp.]